MAAGFSPPFPDISHPVLAEVVHDIALLLLQEVTHEPVGLRENLQAVVLSGDVAVVAPVVLEQVKTPFSKTGGIERLMLVRSRETRTGSGAGRGVDAGLKAVAMDVVRQGIHVGEVPVRQDVPAGVTKGTDTK